ncbi:hypothetical protein HK405_006117 [Cladochytrium tenue]|nr:hypothetical protein HK405_006117 [Cladochytrium tenue]
MDGAAAPAVVAAGLAATSASAATAVALSDAAATTAGVTEGAGADPLFGAALSLFGSALIGCGQTLQKWALNRLAARSAAAAVAAAGSSSISSPSSPSVSDEEAAPAAAASASSADRGGEGGGGLVSVAERLRDPAWIAGISLCYAGEVFGNWIALGYVSAAVVTPMGAISVLVTALLGSMFLGEEITLRQRRGYAVLLLSVLAILAVAPRGDAGGPGSTPAAVLAFCRSPGFLLGLLAILAALAGLLYLVVVVAARRGGAGGGAGPRLHELAALCAAFGAVCVVCGRVLSVMARVGLLASPTAAALAALLAAAVVSQEFFKQQALSRFAVSAFQPVLFAAFNSAAALASLAVFREAPSTAALALFIAVFVPAMAGILVGSKMIQRDDDAPHAAYAAVDSDAAAKDT